ncbi:tryptophan-tRNA ligase [Exophiala xenobiotica]|uniref:tryptophan--tRNA ligase n=1 Tax=Exophiala xenobiotica TaxID=348802 RepID=A0A0D2D3N7_9EURO|nr:tryptophan-tRNA ligase [Exophiala xenobiotica]KIW56952.1 tryptophan-tRNA ligase [Exophiala xenobiotica]
MLSRARCGDLRAFSARKIQCRYYSDEISRPSQHGIDSKPAHGRESDERSPKEKAHTFHQSRRVFSGIQPTGVPHLGNYLGALRQWKFLHDSSANAALLSNAKPEQYFSVVDLHALTSTDIPGPERWRLRKESYASLMAIGLKNSLQTTLFFQSDVMYHAELMWILSTIASTGYLSRMTQWKSKLNLPENADIDSDEATAKLKLGLFSYPVLQAADILLYQATLVPVGEDQLQHIEFARSLARSFNSHLRQTAESPNLFRVPRPALSPARRIMSLKRPTQKMSKSDADPKSRILITDTREEIHAKVKGAITDSEPGISFDPEKRPGVSNLIEILRTVTSISDSAEKIAKDLEHMTMRAFKEMVADNVSECLRGIRESFLDLMEPTNHTLNDEVREGARKAHARASWTMKNVRNSLGLQTLKIPSGEAEPENANDAGEDDAHDPQTDVHEVKIRYCKSETAGAIQEALAGLSKQSFPASEPENSAKSRS